MDRVGNEEVRRIATIERNVERTDEYPMARRLLMGKVKSGYGEDRG